MRLFSPLTLSAVLLAPGCARGDREPGSDDVRPNVVLVVIDTLRADALEPWGGDPRTSPNISAWAKEGAVFADCRAASPWTLPSMATILTGLYPRSHGAHLSGLERRLFADEGRELDPLTAALPRESRVPPRIAADVPTIADAFRKEGYATWMIATNPFVGYGLEDGFGYYSNHVLQAGVVVDSAALFLAKTKKRPFLLVLHFIDTHATSKFGLESMKKDLDAFADPALRPLTKEDRTWPELDDDPALFRDELEARRRMYAVTTHFVDRHLGRLWRKVEEHAQRPTYLVVTSDHGEDFRDHWETDVSSGYTDPRREWKGVLGFGHGHNLHRALTHVPLLVMGPGVPAGARIDERVGLVDVLPTLCGLAGVPVPDGVQGHSLVPLLHGEELAAPPYLAESLAYGREKQALFADDWLFVRPVSEDERPQLFDLAHDPMEQHDLAPEKPEVVAELDRELDELLSRLPQRSGVEQPVGAAQAADLGDLGYAGDDD